MNLKKHLLGQIIVPAFFSIVIILTGYFLTEPNVKSLVINERKQMEMVMINNIIDLLNEYNLYVQNGKLSLDDAKSKVIDIIKCQHFGKNRNSYFWIQDYDKHTIYHPYSTLPLPQYAIKTSSIQAIGNQITEMVQKHGGGFIYYNWHYPQIKIIESQKITYVKGYKPWGWIVCYGFMLNDINAELNELSAKVLHTLFAFTAGLMLILIILLRINYKNLLEIFKTNLEITKNEVRFRGLVEHIGIGLMIFEDGKPVFANRQFCSIFSLKKIDLKNFMLDDYLPESERAILKSIIAPEGTHHDIHFETRLLLPGKTEKFVNLHFINEGKAIKSLNYLIIHDYTEQKEKQATIDILSQSLAKSPTAILITNLDGTIEYVNPGFEKVSGYTFEEIKNKNARFLRSDKMSPLVFKDMWKTITNGEIWKGDLLNTKKDGTLYWESTIIFPIKNSLNNIIKYAAIKTDITYNKQIELELLIAKDKAEQNEKLKSALLNNVSHEVRTPINAIYGFTQILKSEFENNERIYSFLKIMEQNSQILLHLFDDILDVSAIESKAITLQKEDILFKEFILKLISKFNSQLAISNSKTVEILIDNDNNFDNMVLFSDRKRLSQIFDKLISNAVKFTNSGQIKISYIITYEYITFYISDTGVGIPENEKELIFENFSHGEHMYIGLHKGVGLGLNVAKLLIELLGGQLNFISEEGKGSIFSFTFPSIDLKNYEINGIPINYRKHIISGNTILIAEGNDDHFIYLESLLSNNTIIRAKTGLEVLNLIESDALVPNIILMDILMPELDGIAASRQIRNLKPSIPIIAISSFGKEIPVTEGIFDIIISKPAVAKILIEEIHRLIDK